MKKLDQHGQADLTTILVFVGLIVAGVWTWKWLSPDTQDYLVEHIIPIALIGMLSVLLLWSAVGRIRRHRERRYALRRLLAEFERERSPEKRRDLAFSLIETNRYRLEGLEQVGPGLVDLFLTTINTAQGYKQHRIRGMAASYVGVLQDRRAIPFLIAALEDDHAHVRACAALGLW